jgi:hypothetical protein
MFILLVAFDFNVTDYPRCSLKFGVMLDSKVSTS